MKFVLSGIVLVLCSYMATAQQKSEEALVNKILQCFASEDDSAYLMLFPKFDSLWNMTMKYADTGIIDKRRISNLRSNPQQLQKFDPQYNSDIINDFKFIHKKGIDSGLHWRDILLARYELEKAVLPRELIGFEKIVPYRLQGYVFVQDLLTRRVFCIAVKDVHGYNNKWYGGRIVNMLEAENTEEYFEKLAKERKVLKDVLLAQLYAADDTAGQKEDSMALALNKKATAPLKMKTDDEEEKKQIVSEVVDRKLYSGTFDNEVGLELYIRSLKGKCPQAVCGWDALYRFQDMEGYVRLEVTKSADGKLVLTEDEVGVMEIEIKGDKITGEWTSFKDKTTADVVLTEKKEVKNRKLFMLDDILENGTGDTE